MILDLKTLSDGETLEADVCIAGAGAAGITLARKLSGAGLDIILLESGGFEISEAHQDLYRGKQVGIDSWSLHDHRWRLFGGSTARWAGWCMPLSEGDFEERSWIPESGWPITFADLAPHYEVAQEDLQLASFMYDGRAVADAAGQALIDGGTGRIETRMFQFSRPTRMGTLYRAELEEAADVRVYTDANLVDIVLESALGRVQRFAVRTLDGSVNVNVEASRFVLAMGGLENARLLLASDGQIPEGVANSSGRVGRFFMEHPHLYDAAFAVASERIDRPFYNTHDASWAVDGGGTRSQRVLGVLGVSEEVRRAEGLPDLTVSINASAVDGRDTGDIGANVIAALNGASLDAHHAASLTVRAEQTPLERSALTLTDDRDAFGMRRIALDWAVRDEDLRAYARSFEILGAELAASRLGRLWHPMLEEMRLDTVIKPGGHHLGTTRMHADPARGVVDADCRAHDHDNLYLAGSSVFTTGGAANPTLTICALANRLAAHLRGDGS